MRPPLKLSAIDQEHLQELYNAAGVARDELPYTPAFDTMCQGFQDRTFKNAHPEQVFGAILKYVRSSGNVATVQETVVVNEDQARHLKGIVARNAVHGKLLPYSDEFTTALNEFKKVAGAELSEGDFWKAIQQAQGAKRRPPPRKKAAAKAEEDDDAE